jgi:hypothetical protein
MQGSQMPWRRVVFQPTAAAVLQYRGMGAAPAMRTPCNGGDFPGGMVVAMSPDMADVLRILTTPYYLMMDFALDAPASAATLALLAGAAGLAAYWG